MFLNRLYKPSIIRNLNIFILLCLMGSIHAKRKPIGPIGPKGYKYLGVEGQVVFLKRKSRIAYGANSKFVYKVLQGKVFLNNGTFRDPIPGVKKYAFFRTIKSIINSGEELIPDGYKYLGKENTTQYLKKYSMVAYGAGNKFVYRGSLIGCVDLSNAFFGDPTPGRAKHGYVKSMHNHRYYNEFSRGPKVLFIWVLKVRQQNYL